MIYPGQQSSFRVAGDCWRACQAQKSTGSFPSRQRATADGTHVLRVALCCRNNLVQIPSSDELRDARFLQSSDAAEQDHVRAGMRRIVPCCHFNQGGYRRTVKRRTLRNSAARKKSVWRYCVMLPTTVECPWVVRRSRAFRNRQT